MTTIKSLTAMEVFDSRGNPTVMVTAELSDGTRAAAMVPSGASTGTYEACELRDGDAARYGGKGVQRAVANVNGEISTALRGMDATQQREIDLRMVELDGTNNKSRLGANAILGVSLAVCRAAAASSGQPLYQRFSDIAPWDAAPSYPVPLMNIINGGVHASASADFQEFMIVPRGARTFTEAMRMGAEVYAALKKNLAASDRSINIGDEGGFAPTNITNVGALDLAATAVTDAGYTLGTDIFLALDVAATEIYDSDTQRYQLSRSSETLTGSELGALYTDLAAKYPLISIEDPFAENDWQSWSELTASCGERLQIVGDDLFVTQTDYLQRGIRERAANAILVKINQVGTLTETLDTIKMARDAGFNYIISHRSGETEDSTIADLAVGTGAGQIKTGAPARGERTAKYNRILQIEAELGETARYAGGS